MGITIKLTDEADQFITSQPENARKKIEKTIRSIEYGVVNKDLFKKIKGTEIWEIRTLYGGMAYRIMAFWDKRQRSLIIATHGFVKKTQKTPEKEIDKAVTIMKEYYNDK